MKTFQLILLIVASLELQSGYATIKALEILDNDEHVLASEIMENICDHGDRKTKQIARPSTIIKLDVYFKETILTKAGKFLDCVKRNHLAVRKLKDLISTTNDNVCSNEKLLLIDEFHRNYISTAIEDKKSSNKGEYKLPIILKLFFMHYTMEVSAICKKGLINNLEWDLKDTEFNVEKDLNLIDKTVLYNLSTVFNSMTSVESYEDVIILWDIIDGSSMMQLDQNLLKNNNQLLKLEDQNFIHPLTKEKKKLLIKVKNSRPILEFQQKCRIRFRPIYEKLILPIVSLADLGYSCTGERFAKELDELKKNELVKKWYVVTQICETILPIYAIQDSTLANNETTIIITKEEADELLKREKQPELALNKEDVIVYEPTTLIFDSKDKIYSVETTEAQELVENIKLNVDARSRSIQRAMKRFSKDAIDIAKTKLKSILFSRINSGGNNYEVKNIIDIVDKKVSTINDDDLLNLEGSSRHHIIDSIQRNQRHNRIADVQTEVAEAEAELDHMHTKSWNQIWSEFVDGVSSIFPSRLCIFVAGSIVVIILIVLIILILGGSLSSLALLG